MTRSLILRNPAIRDLAVSAIANLPTDPDSPLEVVIRPYRAQRKLEQLGLYWLRLKEISEQAYIGGRRYSDDVLHEHCKREFLPERDDPELEKKVKDPDNYRKWDYLPSGEKVLVASTSNLTVYGFACHTTQTEAWGAGLGVMFTDGRMAA